MHEYFSGQSPLILAHRGWASTTSGKSLDENTLAAFGNALSQGATHIETDIQCSSDGVPVIFHDQDLSRVSNLNARIADLTWRSISKVQLHFGGAIPRLVDALETFPDARFNIDFKVKAVIEPAARVISAARAEKRVLVASFSESRRRCAKALLPGAATSASGFLSAELWFAHKANLTGHFARLAKSVDALQIPVSSGPIHFDDTKFVNAVRSAGLQLHYWTVNDTAEMQRLVRLGATGIVTDRTDVAVVAFRR